MTKKKILDSIDVKSPCSESWDEMFGNDEVRFCSHCAKNVHNLSAMTQKKAEELVKKSEGKLCVRYIKTPEGKLISAPPKLTKITRRATIAASVLATSLTLSTMAYSQDESLKLKDNSTQNQKDILSKDVTTEDIATISGTVADETGAVIPNSQITLKESKTNQTYKTESNNKGFYEFKNIERGIYKIFVTASGFSTLIVKEVEIKDKLVKKDLKLEIVELMGEIILIEFPTRISGLIKDRNNGLIPDAKIVLRDLKTDKTLETKSNSVGFYEA